ncbi:hypothetical protein [Sandaracinus amylolyticus]|uniref:STAS/SEC14 domain-containing protein n=1 Tax=Sandaracinus amylolyticus TaxID=927083 RepID=A0A0F6W6Z6_9BACT|nr:hypothetical protein [Sandaracinus amylolyticus]AKF09017.1 hypothetical protein DB32_006166 [Sandaracinus amylolyticus]
MEPSSRNMAMGRITGLPGGRELVVAMHTTLPPSEEEWNAWVALLEERSRAVDWDLERIGNLAITDGGAPDMTQRAPVNALIAQGRTYPNVALVTVSTVVRTVARAFTLFNPRFAVFVPGHIGDALAWLGVEPGNEGAILDALVDIERDTLGPGRVATLGAIRRALR